MKTTEPVALAVPVKQACCRSWSTVLEAARRNHGVVLADDGTPIWDLGTQEAAGIPDEQWKSADLEMKFCPFCGCRLSGRAAPQPRPVALPEGRPWTIQEAAAYLRMDHLRHPAKQILRWVRSGELHALRRGDVLLFEKRQLDTFLMLHRH